MRSCLSLEKKFEYVADTICDWVPIRAIDMEKSISALNGRSQQHQANIFCATQNSQNVFFFSGEEDFFSRKKKKKKRSFLTREKSKV